MENTKVEKVIVPILCDFHSVDELKEAIIQCPYEHRITTYIRKRVEEGVSFTQEDSDGKVIADVRLHYGEGLALEDGLLVVYPAGELEKVMAAQEG